jgi:murein DD-endopeptidase MepM/ murein hydrolase activator NlpD
LKRREKKYVYNVDTHKFEKVEISWRTRLLRILGFVSASLVTAGIIVAIAFRFIDSPGEKKMRTNMNNIRDEYSGVQAQIDDLNKSISELENRDNNIYRTIFEAAPIPDSIRYGKNYSRIDPKQFANLRPEEVAGQVQEEIAQLRNRITAQQHSDDTIEHLVKSKEQMLRSIPAIQPISNKDLSHLASGFGYRIDPIYKTVKMHTGLDFATGLGTPIYATGDGTVTEADYDAGGYGNHVVINHGFGYESLYGHMVRIKAHVGAHVKRGEVIGWVGSTGKSTGPHCHYEVIKNGEKINPVHYFFNDLTAAEYDRMLRISAAGNQSFD